MLSRMGSSLLVLAVVAGVGVDIKMNTSTPPPAKPVSAANAAVAKDALAGAPGEKSACGLPSNVVIDMSKAAVRRTDDEWRAQLTPLQFRVARQQGTEPPFRNEYWDHHEDGVYFSICSNTPLFDSRDKFESGTGWPSFTKPIEQAFVEENVDVSLGMRRVEVSCNVDGGHLGHVFPDGPRAQGGWRYCINSAALRFMLRKEYEEWMGKHAGGVGKAGTNS